jgi:hypothetical protein
MSANPTALQLRYLQTLLELGSSQASTIVFPLPIDLLKPLLEGQGNGPAAEGATRPRPAPAPPAPLDEGEPSARELAQGVGAAEPEGTPAPADERLP